MKPSKGVPMLQLQEKGIQGIITGWMRMAEENRHRPIAEEASPEEDWPTGEPFRNRDRNRTIPEEPGTAPKEQAPQGRESLRFWTGRTAFMLSALFAFQKRQEDADMEKKTLLWPVHQTSGAVMGAFAGWDMPIRYGDIQAEHEAVRTAAGLFDVSHMGELRLAGPGALTFADSIVTNRVSLPDEPVARAIYSPMCHPNGGTVDDLFLYVHSQEDVLLVVNAGNIAKDEAHIRSLLPEGIILTDESSEWMQLALQGPAAGTILAGMPLFSETGVSALRFMRWMPTRLDGREAILSRSGYTGGDGFEVYVRTTDPVWAAGLWTALLEKGRPYGLVPAGLGARDTLRLEGALPLYGHELADDISPLEAGLNRFVKLDKPFFTGRNALLQQAGEGTHRMLVGLELVERGIAREGCLVFPAEDMKEEPVGVVTSGGVGIHIGQNIAMALVSHGAVRPGDEVQVEVRGRRIRARVTPLPFYRGTRNS